MAHVNPDNQDIARTFAFCPATSLPGQTGHIPLGMSACPVSGPEEVGRWRKAIERSAWKTAPHRHVNSNTRDSSADDIGRSKALASATECSVLQGKPWLITVIRRVNLVSVCDNLSPHASRLGDLISRSLNLLNFRTHTRCVSVIGSSETREFTRNACNRTIGKKTGVGAGWGEDLVRALYSTFPFSHAASPKTLLHFGHRNFWAADFEKSYVYK